MDSSDHEGDTNMSQDGLSDNVEKANESNSMIASGSKRSLTLANDSEDDGDFTPTPYKRFEPAHSNAAHNWSMSNDMLQYASKQFLQYIPETDLKDSILTKNPIPQNFIKSGSMDDFMKGVLEVQRTNNIILHDKLLQKVQDKLLCVMGPLSRSWNLLEEAMNSGQAQMKFNLDDFIALSEQTIVLLGQAYNNINYNRRLSILSSIMQEHKAKALLKEKSDMFSNSQSDFLFGQQFQEDWKQTMKTKHQYQDILRKENRSDNVGRGSRNQPFRGDPSRAMRRGRGGFNAVFVRRGTNAGRGRGDYRGRRGSY